MNLTLSGLRNLTNTIMNTQPGLSEDEAIVISDKLINEVSERIERGEQLAFLGQDDDGSSSLTIIEYFIKHKD